jgi:hypothetical protein
MSERYSGFVVTLKEDIGEDGCKAITNAIRLIQGVVSVESIAGGAVEQINRERIRQEIGEQLLEIVYPSLRKRESR